MPAGFGPQPTIQTNCIFGIRGRPILHLVLDEDVQPSLCLIQAIRSSVNARAARLGMPDLRNSRPSETIFWKRFLGRFDEWLSPYPGLDYELEPWRHDRVGNVNFVEHHPLFSPFQSFCVVCANFEVSFELIFRSSSAKFVMLRWAAESENAVNPCDVTQSFLVMLLSFSFLRSHNDKMRRIIL